MLRVWLGKAWRFLSQLRFGVILLALLLGAVIFGTLFPQLPQQADPDAWWAAVRDRYGALYGLFRAFGVFDLYNSVWFQGLLGLLLLSTLACFLNRVWPLSRVVFRPRTRLPVERFEKAELRAQLSFSSPQAAESALRSALQRQLYRVQTERQTYAADPSRYQIHVRADRHRLPRLGTLLTHLGLITLLLGALWGGLRGWRATPLEVNSRDVTPVGHGTGVRLRCSRFAIPRYDDGTPRDYRADVILSDEAGEILTQATVRINHPLTFDGVSYYLQGFHLPIPTGGATDETELCGITLSAVHDPGYVPVIVAGLCLFVGVTLTFHFPHRRLWARIDSEGIIALVGSTAWDRERFAVQFETLVAELGATGSLET